MSPKGIENNSISKTEELLFEDTFRGTLASLKRLLLQYQPNQDTTISRDMRIDEHAQELISEEIRRTTTKMQNLQTNSFSETKSHKIAAYSFISAQIIDELENIVSQKVTLNSLF